MGVSLGQTICEHGKSKRFCSDCTALYGLRTAREAPHPVEYLDAKDQTQLTYGPGSAPIWRDPDAAVRARKMLLWIPTAPGFEGSLDDREAKVWGMWFSGLTQAGIAATIGLAQSTISKIVNGCVRKLNGRYLKLRTEDALPIAVLAWLYQATGSTSGDARTDTDFLFAVQSLRRRDAAIRRGDLAHATTGDEELDALAILNC